MKRWVAALVAAPFSLSTATLHVFAHHGAVDDGCAVCHVQRAGLPAAPAPSVAAAPLVAAALAETPAPSAVPARPSRALARAPPVLRA